MAEREHIGFIVSAWDASGRSGGDSRIRVTGRLKDGRSFALLAPSAPPSLYVALDQGAQALEALCAQNFSRATLDSQAWPDLPGSPLARLIVTRATPGAAERAQATRRNSRPGARAPAHRSDPCAAGALGSGAHSR